MINALLAFMEGAAAKATAAGSGLASMAGDGLVQLAESDIGQMILQPSGGGMSMGVTGSMGDTEDSAQLVQDANSRAGIQNEAVNFLQPTPAMASVGIPQLPSYREPLPQVPSVLAPQVELGQPPPMQTESELRLQRDLEAIRNNMPPPR